MSDFFAKIILAARNDDEVAGWMQMLVFAILAVFYVLGSILKARANKAKEKEELAGKPAHKPPEGAKGLQRKAFKPIRPAAPLPRKEYYPQVQPPSRRVVRPRPAARAKPAAQPPALPEVEELPRFTRGLDKKMGVKELGIPSESPQVKPIGEPLLDYTDPNRLRRAILHYEIFGKPLSLRGPEEHIIGL